MSMPRVVDSRDSAKPEVAVVVPVRDGADFLAVGVEDAVGMFRDADVVVEIIIVDDGSSDATPEVIAGLTRRHPAVVRAFRLPATGVSAARNVAIAASSAPYIGFLDADDRLLPTVATTLLSIVKAGRADIAQGLIRDIWPGRGEGRTYAGVPVSSLLVRREVFARIGGFDEDLPVAEDYDWLLRAYDARVTKERVDEVAFEYLRRRGGLSNCAALPASSMIAPQHKAFLRRRAGVADVPAGFPSLADYLGVPPPDVHSPPPYSGASPSVERRADTGPSSESREHNGLSAKGREDVRS